MGATRDGWSVKAGGYGSRDWSRRMIVLDELSGASAGAREATMTVLIRSITYATLFIGFVLVYLPAQMLSGAGVTRPTSFGATQMAGMLVAAAGAAIAIWCILAFALVGRGTPAPFDPPRRLVVVGPYRYVRNPMYLGAGLALAGAALVYDTGVLWAYVGAFLVVTHSFVVLYEEPTLRRTFGDDYEAYCRQVRRWWPGRSPVTG